MEERESVLKGDDETGNSRRNQIQKRQFECGNGIPARASGCVTNQIQRNRITLMIVID
jgi:hypothetical protein